MQIEVKESFIRDVKTVPKEVKLKLNQLILSLEQADSLTQLTAVKKLTGYTNFYRIRVGDYRLGFALIDNKLVLVRCLHRKDIYRFFP